MNNFQCIKQYYVTVACSRSINACIYSVCKIRTFYLQNMDGKLDSIPDADRPPHHPTTTPY